MVPLTKASNTETVSIWWRHHAENTLFAEDTGIGRNAVTLNSMANYDTLFLDMREKWRGAYNSLHCLLNNVTQIAKYAGPTCGPPGSCRPQMGPMLAPWTLLSGTLYEPYTSYYIVLYCIAHHTSKTQRIKVPSKLHYINCINSLKYHPNYIMQIALNSFNFKRNYVTQITINS